MQNGLGLSTSFSQKGTPPSLQNGLILDKSIFVSKNGNDTTAQPYRLDLPYLTPQSAINNAQSGDTVIIYAGEYNLNASNNLLKDGVNIFCYTGVIIKLFNEIGESAAIFDDLGNDINATITGDTFIIDGANSGVFGAIFRTNGNSNLKINCINLLSTNSQNCIFEISNSLITANVQTYNSYICGFNGTSNIIINVNYMNTGGLYVQDNAKLTINANTLEGNANNSENDGLYTDSNAICNLNAIDLITFSFVVSNFSTINVNANTWVTSPETRHALLLNGNAFFNINYIDCTQGDTANFGAFQIQGGSNFYIKCIECTSSNTERQIFQFAQMNQDSGLINAVIEGLYICTTNEPIILVRTGSGNLTLPNRSITLKNWQGRTNGTNSIQSFNTVAVDVKFFNASSNKNDTPSINGVISGNNLKVDPDV